MLIEMIQFVLRRQFIEFIQFNRRKQKSSKENSTLIKIKKISLNSEKFKGYCIIMQESSLYFRSTFSLT